MTEFKPMLGGQIDGICRCRNPDGKLNEKCSYCGGKIIKEKLKEKKVKRKVKE